VLSRTEIADEMLVMGLRIGEGLNLARLAALAGVTPAAESLRDLASLGLVTESAGGRRLVATPRGRMVLDAVIRELAGNLVAVPR
jgi:oxygen-independent coproporphyrinogen-3 oxidase